MQRIFKYELELTDEQEVTMPREAVILSVAEQHGRLCLWAQVTPDNMLERRTVRIYGTGNPLPTIEGTFVGTVVMSDRTFVWHVFCF
jgi:hypothetical protein